MAIKFIKDGQVKAVLRDDGTEPEGIEFRDDLAEDFIIPEGVQSLEEMDDSVPEDDLID